MTPEQVIEVVLITAFFVVCIACLIADEVRAQRGR